MRESLSPPRLVARFEPRSHAGKNLKIVAAVPPLPTDLTQAAADIAAGRALASDTLDRAVAQAALGTNRHTFIRRFDASARASAQAVDLMRQAGAPVPALAGLAVSVKDLFDVAGFPTTAASRSLQDTAPATADCPAVARLRTAGAALVGHTNMTEFAFSGVGINPHYGTPANPATAALDAEPRIPGGSTSGGAVSVATGAAWASLGSDTGGSIRIPAALQGLVGFKCTASLVPTEGAIPLSTTLDTACAITRSVRDAVLLHEVLAARRVRLGIRPLLAWRLALPAAVMLDALEPAISTAFERSIATLRAAGAQIEDLELPLLEEAASLQRGGGLSAAESWAWHRRRLTARGAAYDPRVALRIRRGEGITAADYIDLLSERRAWIGRMEAALAGFDALLSPTLPIVAPPIQPLLDSDDAFFAANALLLRNPSLVNLLDGCALSLPCHRAGEWPVGLMVWGAGGTDDVVLGASLAIEHALRGDA
jgi:amidase/aspartyl-tRNA(Asn)/glutamyl-tRNA(Gln) amidotransferase subunit A